MELLTGILYFSIQIYCDFSGYSDIAKGTAKLFGIELLDNFRFPYFSKNISEFWRRWHISLSSWFRDYVYIPLGGSKVSNIIALRNVFVVFVLSGFWHGSKWTYIFWGFYHAILFFPMFLRKTQKDDIEIVKNTFFIFPSFKDLGKMMLTYSLVNIGWVFFRAESMGQAISIIKSIIGNKFLPVSFHFYNFFGLFVIIYLFAFEWINKEKGFGLDIGLYPKFIRRCIYLTTIFLIYLMYSPLANSTFIYFQF
jgi:alginate O-acetyltransferase complex protein AlgI